MTKHFLTGFLLVMLAAPAARAQTPANPDQPWGNWFIGTVVLAGNPTHKWGGYAELQARTDGLFRRYFYNERKAGISYDIDPNFTVLLGGGRYATSDYRDLSAGPLNVEYRLWEQLVLSQYSHRLKLEHRYRIEQRWLAFRGDSSAFRQRIRYRFNAFLPLNNKAIVPGTLFLSVYDEIFLNPKGPVFERNRLYGGVGYQFDPHFTLQVGYVHQANFNLPAYKAGQFIPQNTAAKDNLVISLTYKLARQNAVEKLPSHED